MRTLLLLTLMFASLPARAQTAADGWLGVAASRRGSTLAIWDEDRILVSRDDGATFPEVFPAPTRHGRIAGVVIDDDGSLVVRWGDDCADVPVELIRPSGVRTTITEHGAVAIAAGSGTRAVLTRDALLVSFARGRFETHPLPPACEECEPGVGQLALGVGAHGEVSVSDVEINTCGSRDRVEWQRLGRLDRGDGALAWSSVMLPHDEGGALLTPALWGWTYGVTTIGTPWARTASRSVPIAGLARGAGYGDLDLSTNGRIVLVLHDGALLELVGAESRVLDADPPSALALAVDARGRALAIDASGSVVRFSRRTGWAVIIDAGAAEVLGDP